MSDKFDDIDVPHLRKLCKKIFHHDCKKITRKELIRRLSEVNIEKELITDYKLLNK